MLGYRESTFPIVWAVSSEFVIVSKPNDTAMLLNRNQLSSWAMNIFSAGKHLFGGNQINSYTVAVASYPIANKVGVEFNVHCRNP